MTGSTSYIAWRGIYPKMSLRKRRNTYGEYVIHFFVPGTFRMYPVATDASAYFTEDWEDAVGTFEQICKDCHWDMGQTELTKEELGNE